MKGRELNVPRLRHRQAPSTEHAKPRPMGRVLGRPVNKKKLAVSSQTVAKATQIVVFLVFTSVL